MATTPVPEASEGPVLCFISKRLRALRKKLNRILQTEESIAKGKSPNKEQEELLRSKASICAAIDELEKLRSPLAAAVTDEIRLAVKNRGCSNYNASAKDRNLAETDPVEDLLSLIYFGSVFDLKNQNDFTLLTRTHERGCCITYDVVTDDDNSEMLCDRDLDMVEKLASLLTSRPISLSLSHKDSLQRCIHHAKQWLAKSDQPIDSDCKITYAELRAKLDKIMASGYFTAMPEIKAAVEMAAGNYTSFQVPVQESVVPAQLDGSGLQFQQKDEELAVHLESGTCNSQPSYGEEAPKGEFQPGYSNGDLAQAVVVNPREEDQSTSESEAKEHYKGPPRNHNRGSSRSGSRRGFHSGRGAQGSSRGGGAYCSNGGGQCYEDGNSYPNSYHKIKERGGREGAGGGSRNFNNNHGVRAQASYVTVGP